MKNNWLFKISISIILIFSVILLSVYYFNKPEFSINVNPKGQIKYSQREDNGEIIRYDFHTIKNGEKKKIYIIDKDDKRRCSIVNAKGNENGTIVFDVGSFSLLNNNTKKDWFFPDVKEKNYLVFVSPSKKIVAKRQYFDGLITKMKWINNKKLKLEISNKKTIYKKILLHYQYMKK